MHLLPLTKARPGNVYFDETNSSEQAGGQNLLTVLKSRSDDCWSMRTDSEDERELQGQPGW